MKTRFLRGSTQENNNLTLNNGELSIDLEKRAVRLHDGQTLGGFEVIGTQAYTPVGHGPQSPIGGDATWGFYGEVLSGDFITGDVLATTIGLSAGTSQHSSSNWLKFASNGKTILVPKLTFRHSMNWEDIYQAGAVYGDDTNGSNPSGTARLQDTVVTVDGFDYRVRLLRGAGTDPTTQGADGLWYGYDVDLGDGSEWNRLIYPIHSGDHTEVDNPTPHTDPNADPYASWASYSDTDLLVDAVAGYGSFNLCMESAGDISTARVARGGNGLTWLSRYSSTSSANMFGWRPVLELVE